MLDGGLPTALVPTRPHSRMSSPGAPFYRGSLEESSDPLQACVSIGRDCNAVALAPDGKRVVLGCQDNTVQIWEADTQVQVQVLRGHKNWVNHVAFSPDGVRIASASADKTIKLWSAARGDCESTLQGHLLSVASVAFSPDCNQLASASWDKTVCIWDVKLGRVLQTLLGHTDWVHGVSWSPGSWQVASASSDHSVRVWSAASGMVEHVLVGHVQTVCCVSFARKDFLLASGSLDRTVRVWNAQEGCFVARLMQESDEGSVNCVCFTADVDRIVIGCSGKCVKVWNFRSGDIESRFVGHEDAVMGVCASPDAQKLFSCGLDKTLRVWKMPPRGPSSAVLPSLLPTHFASASLSAIGKAHLTSRLREAMQSPSKEAKGAQERYQSPKELARYSANLEKNKFNTSLSDEGMKDMLEMKEKLERSFEEMRRELRQLPTSPAGTLPHEQEAPLVGSLPRELRHLPVTPAGMLGGAVNSASSPTLSPYLGKQPNGTDRILAEMPLAFAGSAAGRSGATQGVAYSSSPVALQSLLPAGLAGLGAAGSGLQTVEANWQHASLSRSAQSQRQVSGFPTFPTSVVGPLTPAGALSRSLQARSPRRSNTEARSLSPVSPVLAMPGLQYSVGRPALTRSVH